jgi:CheY-like chemotaxis protein
MSPRTPQTPLRILYVEDNPLVREVTCELLSQPTREVIATASAEEALGLFKPEDFDVVVTDVSLPVMSGLEMTRRILQAVPAMAVIIATGYRLQVDPRGLGPHVRVIEKPFDAPAIDGLLDELCRDSGL